MDIVTSEKNRTQSKRRSHSGSISNSGSHSQSGSVPPPQSVTKSQINSSQPHSPSSARKSRKRNVLRDSEDEASISTSKKFVKINNTDDEKEKDGKMKKAKFVDKPFRPKLINFANRQPTVTLSDFDAMLLRKKEEKKGRRARLDIDNDKKNNELIDELLERMKNAAAEDRQSNREGKPAMEKLCMLKLVTSQLIKRGLQSAFLEHDVLSVLAEWLTPLPNKSLPYHEIRENIFRLLTIQFSKVDKKYLKSSGIGKAVMYLHKHPEETQANRNTAGNLIAGWARTVFGLSDDYRDMSKEERQKRDLARLPKGRKLPEPQTATSAATKQGLNSALNTTEERPLGPDDPRWVARHYRDMSKEERQKSDLARMPKRCKSPKPQTVTSAAAKQGLNSALNSTEERSLRPGDPGWVARARAPMPANKDYIIRPKSTVQADIPKATKRKPTSRYEMVMKKLLETQRNKKKSNHAIDVSIDGRNMSF